MPTYEYECPAGHAFERLAKMSDPPVAECPECGAEARRVISAPRPLTELERGGEPPHAPPDPGRR